MDTRRTITALTASLAIAALVVTAPPALADSATGTPAPTTSTATEAAGAAGDETATETTTSAVTTVTSTTTTTAAPTTTAPATATAPPVPVAFRLGDTGDRVKDLQSRLLVLGRSSGTVDGVYDAGVAGAVAGFLVANHLTGDGSTLTQSAWARLTTQTSSTVLHRQGASGNGVLDLQARLRVYGATYWPYAMDGVFSSNLTARVWAFQRTVNLPQSRVLDQRTWDRLKQLTRSPVYATTGTVSHTVRDAQVRLKIYRASFFTARPDSYYGSTTRAGVLAFQRAVALPQTAVLDRRTWERLRDLTYAPPLLQQGQAGNSVRETQLRLRAVGLWPYAIDGYFGVTLKSRVLTFQRRYNVPQTQFVDRYTWTKMLGLTLVPGTFDQYRYQAGHTPLLPSISSLDARCRTGRVLCVSKRTRTTTWVVYGKPQAVMWARFGIPGHLTREGTFSVLRKYEYVISNLYFVPMPFSMFFSGGQAVHYSSNFARLGYASGSHGCVNIKDLTTLKKVYAQVRIRDKVVVYH